MGVMSQLHMEISDRLQSGAGTIEEIAESLNVPVEWVMEIESELLSSSSYDDYMDGDAETALASAGFGTDEDYGSFYE